MHPINQHTRLSAVTAKILGIAFLPWILILPVPAGLSESPKHCTHYDQLQDSIAALPTEVNSIVSTIGEFEEIQRRTPQTAPQSYDHLQKAIQGLTGRIATLQTQFQGLGCNLTHLTRTVGALDHKLQDGSFPTRQAETILSEKIKTLEGKVQSLTSQQDSDLKKLGFLVVGAVLSLASVWARKIIWEDREQEKERAKERLEKFYAPLLGRLQANQFIWDDIKEQSGILNPIERLRINQERDGETPENIVKDILSNQERRADRLNIWIAAMEGIFRQNNEAAEKTILENYGYLRPEDLETTSAFYDMRKKYLLHVGEFKALLHRWDEATRQETGKNWYTRCKDWTEDNNRGEDEYWKYFHPEVNKYPLGFMKEVHDSYIKLMDEAGLGKKNSFHRILE